MKKLSVKSAAPGKLVAGLSFAVLCTVPGAASADAVAQAILAVTGFKITTGAVNPTGSVSGLGEVNVGLNGVSASTGPVTGPNYSAELSLGAGYVANSKILGAPTGTFVGGKTDVAGNAIVNAGGTGAAALSDSTVSISPQGFGNAATITGTTFDWTFTLTQSALIDIAFDADLFLRSFLSGSPILVTIPPASATANSNWSVSIDGTAGRLFNWAPDGTTGALTGVNNLIGGTVTASAFSLNTGVTASRLLPTPLVTNSFGSFAARTNLIGPGDYTLTINHKTDANARVSVPEPGSLALVGLSLLGLAGIGHRRAKRQAA